MPRKSPEQIRVPLNVLVARVTKESITGIQNQTKESQGEIVDRAVALLALGDEVPVRTRKEPRRVREVRKLAESDVTARVVERDDIEYGSEELPAQHVASVAVGPMVKPVPSTVERRIADWRAKRKPILKPGERK